ncbi:hypothetical protein ACN47E_000779 [Coniothyrium glycines]
MDKEPLNPLVLISKLNQLGSPFLRLSAELRNAIYDYVFTDTRWLVHGRGRWLCNVAGRSGPGFLLVCRQVYLEASIYLFTNSTICASEPTLFRLWIERQERRDLDLITRMELDCEVFVSGKHHDWTVPIEKSTDTLLKFRNLKKLRITINIIGQRVEWYNPHMTRILSHVADMKKGLIRTAPQVDLTVVYNQDKAVEESRAYRERDATGVHIRYFSRAGV